MRTIPMTSAVSASSGAGLLRVGLAGIVALLVSRVWPPPEAVGAYLALGLAIVFGVLLVARRPGLLLREGLLRAALDSALVAVLVAHTGGGDSPFFLLYFLAALEVIRIETRAKVAVATAAMVGGYLAAVVAAGGPGALGLSPVVPRALFLALFCAVVGSLGAEAGGVKKLASGLSSSLAREKQQAERDEGLISRFGPVLRVLSLEEALRWTAEAAHQVGGGSYAHVAMLNGGHRTVLEGDFDVCPSWWHPSIQRLLLWSCLEGKTVRSDEEIHGIEGFVAVPVGPEGGEKLGAVILGGKGFGAEEERALELLVDGIAPVLENAGEASGGTDATTGLPNRASLHRVLRRELSQGRALTVLVMDLDRFRDYGRTYGFAAGDDLLRRIGERLKDNRQRAFRYGDDEFAVVVGGAAETRARRVAAALRQIASEEEDGSGLPYPTAAVGFALAGAGEDPDLVLDTALRALGEARGKAEGVVGISTGAWEEASGDEQRVAGIVGSLVGALEAKDPYIREHLKAVSHLALLIGREMALPPYRMDALRLGALLHDVGKVGIPDRILHKPGRMTGEEYGIMKRHPNLGVEIVSPIKELAPALPAIKHHHERCDGGGYPDGLRGEHIPLVARIVAVADALDSMIRHRPYGYGISLEAALEEIEDNSGAQFDPRVVDALRVVVRAKDLRADFGS